MNHPLHACVIAILITASAGPTPVRAQTAAPTTSAIESQETMAKKIANLEARLKRAETKLGDDPRALTPQNALDRRIESLERRMDKLEREVTSLDSRVKALERKK